MNPITYESIMDEALDRPGWKIDPARAMRALKIVKNHQIMLRLATDDGNGFPLPEDHNIWNVKGRRGWYFVDPDNHSCTCPDARNGHICKHRLAVFLYTQQIERTRAAVIEEARANFPGRQQFQSMLAKQNDEYFKRQAEERRARGQYVPEDAQATEKQLLAELGF